MELGRKVELAEQAIKSITRHDDAPAGEVQDAVGRLVRFASSEISDLDSARAQRKSEREAALRDVTMVDSTAEIVTQSEDGAVEFTRAPEIDINNLA